MLCGRFQALYNTGSHLPFFFISLGLLPLSVATNTDTLAIFDNAANTVVCRSI